MPPTTKTKKQGQEEKIRYPKKEYKMYIPEYEGPMTQAQAKALLFWETETDYVVRISQEQNIVPEKVVLWKNKYLLKDKEGNKVRCWDNQGNRAINESWALSLAYDILNQRWKHNMEVAIVSKYGRVLSAQHRLIGFILACQIWNKDPKKWAKFWSEEPTLEITVAYGCEEDEDTLRTIDNVKPRTLTDVIYTSPLLKIKNDVDKKECARMLEFAVRLLWKRTGAKNEWNPYPTHGAAMDFIGRHRVKILQCVSHIFEENSENGRALSEIGLSPGQCAGLLFLMGSCNSDAEVYRKSNPPTEKKLDWSLWDKAMDFWVLLAKNNPELEEVKEAIVYLNEAKGEGQSTNEIMTVLAKAWEAFTGKGEVAAEDLLIEEENYITKDSGKKVLKGVPSVGGIDLGVTVIKDKDEEEEGESPDQVAESEDNQE